MLEVEVKIEPESFTSCDLTKHELASNHGFLKENDQVKIPKTGEWNPVRIN